MNEHDAKPPDDKDITIRVNTRPHKVPGPDISFDKVLRLANIDITGQDPNLFDVEWHHGNDAGTVKPGQRAPVRNGMRFDAGKSNRS